GSAAVNDRWCRALALPMSANSESRSAAVFIKSRLAAGAQRLNIESAGAVQPRVLVADDGLRGQCRRADRHPLKLTHRRAHGKDLYQAGSEFDNVSLDADHFFPAQGAGFIFYSLENVLSCLVEELLISRD